nr:chemotaxis protein CheW [Comamonas granuli]
MTLAIAPQEPTSSPVGPIAAEYLTFRLGKEEYAIDILRVQEIRGYDAATRIANAPAYVKGVINLRGRIVPIVDLRMLFDLPDPDYDSFTVVIVINVCDTVLGMVVDGVNDVVQISRADVKPAPGFGASADTSYLHGIASIAERMILLLEIEKLVQGAGLGSLHTEQP